MKMYKKGASFGNIVAVIGAILIALGIAWLIAQNWHQIPSFLKILILVLATGCAFTAGVLFKINEYEGISRALIVLGSLLYTLSIFLIAQIFSTKTTLQGTAWLFLLAWIGVILFSYIFNSKFSLIVGFVEILIWINIQYFALFEINRVNDFSVGVLALISLFMGILFYGLNLLHRSWDHKFADLYRSWTFFYFLLFAYDMSFQALLPFLWPQGITMPANALIFILVLLVIGVIFFVAGTAISIGSRKIEAKEILGVCAIVVLLTILIFSTNAVSGTAGTCGLKSCYDFGDQTNCENFARESCEWKQNYCTQVSCYEYMTKSDCEGEKRVSCMWIANQDQKNGGYCSQNYADAIQYDNSICSSNDNKRDACLSNTDCRWNPGYGYFRNKNVPTSLLIVWILSNLIFLGIILAVIGYGSYYRLPAIINLGIIFFVLDIISRYIGFLMDFWGYTSLSVIFITGGIILIAGGWLVEKWRRKLIKGARNTRN